MADYFEIARNLLTLEINTVLKDGMSSQKMPDPEDAVVDVVHGYCDFLRVRVPQDWQPEAAFLGGPFTRVAPADLQQLREIALRLCQANGTASEDKAVLSRIQRNCDQMKDFVTAPVDRDHALTLTTEQAILLRKIWEIGTETVAMQTVVQIDGDVVTRIQPGLHDIAHAALHAAHRQSVEVSFRHWQFLVDTLGRIANALVRDLLP